MMADPGQQKQRFRSLETEEEARRGREAGVEEQLEKEELTDDEREALGHLADPLQTHRQSEPPEPGLSKWREVMQAAKAEAMRKDLSWEEKKQRLHDIYLARRRRRSPVFVATAIGIGVAVAALASMFF